MRKDGCKLISTGIVDEASTMEFNPMQQKIPFRELGTPRKMGAGARAGGV